MNEEYQEEMRRRLLVLAEVTTEDASDSSSGKDFAYGFAAGVSLAGIAATIFAVRKCQNSKTNDDFERH